jgi:glutathione S-transferase
MMKLRYSPTSPYVRKITVLALETGLNDKIERVPTNFADPANGLAAQNPLSKVPALVLDNGTTLYDSPVICEYLDSLHSGTKMFPASGDARWTALRRQALADGIMDAGILRIGEQRRPANEQSPAWLEKQKSIMARGLDALEAESGSFGKNVDIGGITIACAIAYALFRFGNDKPLDNRPKLKAWYESFSQRPSMVATVPVDPK